MTGRDRLRFFSWKEEPRRGREPTAEERARFEEMLLEHDLEGALAQAMAFAMKRSGKNKTMAQQMVDDARRILLERCSWDPKKASLGAYLCGIIRSEHSHEVRDAKKEREHEIEYLTEVETVDGSWAKSPEDLLMEYEESYEGREAAVRELEDMKAHFVASGDQVNLDWIEYSLEDIEDPAEMARLSGRRPEDFYRARDRRARYVQRLTAGKQEKK
jgi:hypothetical protein